MTLIDTGIEKGLISITGIRQQAQQLKDKTNELLKKVSEEIERILIG
jgi:hypothetical protein